MEIKLFLDSHIDAVFGYEMAKMDPQLSPVQREMKSWDFPWRKESLHHYCQLGWSFVSVEGETIRGYLLAQPLLYFNNWTQSVWIEDVSFDSPEIGFELMDTSIRWAKSKHMQKVIFNAKSEKAGFVIEKFEKFQESRFLHLSTTKMQEG